MIRLDPSFFARPITHRGLHDIKDGRPENSIEAALAAIDHGYGIELDVQLSQDGDAIVFHDYETERLLGQKGFVSQLTTYEISKMPLLGGVEPPPTLEHFLTLVDGKVPLLIEIKDQTLKMTDAVGALENAVVKALQGYEGAVGIMSFNPHSVACVGKLVPEYPIGIVTDPYLESDWPFLDAKRRQELATIPDFDRLGASFISHNVDDLKSEHVSAIASKGGDILCWTVKSKGVEKAARLVAQNVTFEGYLA